MTRHSHEKARPCQAVFLGRAIRSADCRPTGGTVSFQPFLHRKVLGSAVETADRRPAGGAQCCRPEFLNHRLALLPSALFVERLLRCQLGVLNWKRVLPSRTRTERLCFPATSFLARAAVTRTRRFALSPVKRQLSSVPVVRCDSAMARTLHPLPTADEAESLVFAQPPQPLSSCHAFRHV